MIREDKRPAADARPGVKEYRCTSILPRCELYDKPIIDRLPDGCPFASGNCLVVIWQWQNLAYRLMDLKRPDADPARGLALLERVKTCDDCISRLAGHPLIKRLRPPIHRGEFLPGDYGEVPVSAGSADSSRIPSVCSEPQKIISRRVARPGAILCR